MEETKEYIESQARIEDHKKHITCLAAMLAATRTLIETNSENFAFVQEMAFIGKRVEKRLNEWRAMLRSEERKWVPIPEPTPPGRVDKWGRQVGGSE